MPDRKSKGSREPPRPAEQPPPAEPSLGKAATARAKSAQPAKPEAAFDIWLDRGLHKLFDTIAQEPIPDALLKIIEQDRLKK